MWPSGVSRTPIRSRRESGPITGGLLEFAPAGNFLLDHDQRNTVTSVLSLSSAGPRVGDAGVSVRLRLSEWRRPLAPAAALHLRPVDRQDDSARSVTVSASAVNIANTRYLLDTSNTFGGTHYINPRQIYGEVRYRFHF